MEKNLSAGSQERVVVSHIVDPHKIYVRRASQRAALREMEREFKNAGSFAQLSAHRVNKGEAYLVYVREIQQWRRCLVEAVIKENNRRLFKVFEFDYGTTQTVSVHKLRPLPPSRMHNPPPLAISCRLADCEPVAAGAWTEEDREFVQNFIGDKRVVMLVHPFHIQGKPVECYLMVGDISVADALASEGRAVVPAKFERPIIEDVVVTQFVCPDSFHVRKKRHESAFHKLCDDLHRRYANEYHSVPMPEKGVAYVAKIARLKLFANVPGSWARVVVLDVEESGRTHVQLTDTGERVCVPKSALRRIRSRFARLEPLATECRLIGIVPSQEKWPHATIEFARDLLNTYAPMRVEYVRVEGDSDPIPVVLWLEHTTYGGALEPNIKEWRSVAEIIVHEGLAIPNRACGRHASTWSIPKEVDRSDPECYRFFYY